MLVSFSVSNFRSFGDEVTLNMVASNKLEDHPGHLVPISGTKKHLVRAAVLYGANAAGKSNLIKAIGLAQRLILERNERASWTTPFRFRPELAKTPSSFEFRILIGDRVFIYGFDILSDRFTSEWLFVLKGEEEIQVFERDDQGNTTVNDHARKLFPDDSTTFNTLNALKVLQVRKNQLFLNRAIELPEAAQGATLSSIIKWFTTDLVVLSVDSRLSDILDQLHNDAQFKDFCSRFLNNVGTGVGDLFVRETERDGEEHERRYLAHVPTIRSEYGLCDKDSNIRLKPDAPTRVIVRKLFASHEAKSGAYPLPFSEESDGTQSLLQLMPALSTPPGQSRVVVIDELDRSLHPLLCWEYIRFFSESTPGSRKQLIVTTHEAHLLDQELLRRDEYWFVEKDESQQSQLVSLCEFNVRNDLQIQKGYLHGRFGAIPIMGGMQKLQSLLDCINREATDAAKVSPT